MSSKLYVGNLPFSASEDSLRAHFEQCGTVTSCKIIIDRDTGRSKGFAFVETGSPDEAQTAISKLSGGQFEGRPLNVSEARPMQPRGGGGGFGDDRPRGGNGGNRSRGGHRGW
jgi:RNA recognition motif-containing protein